MENVVLLINLVREHPYLYNKTDKRYKDIRIKENAWKEIVQTLLAADTECERLWKSIRHRYSRGRKKAKSKRSGTGAKNVTKWAWYDDLTFLDECIQERSRTSNIKGGVDGKKSTCLEIATAGPVSSQPFSEHDSTDEFSVEDIIFYTETTHNTVTRSYIPIDSMEIGGTQPLQEIQEELNREAAEPSKIVPAPLPTKTRRLTKENTAKNKDAEKKNLEIDQQIMETLGTIRKPPNEESAFGQLVAHELTQIKDGSKRRALKRKIINLIYEDQD